MKFSGKVKHLFICLLAENKRLNFGGEPDLDPYRNTGKACLGGGMHCHSASSLTLKRRFIEFLYLNASHRHRHCNLASPESKLANFQPNTNRRMRYHRSRDTAISYCLFTLWPPRLQAYHLWQDLVELLTVDVNVLIMWRRAAGSVQRKCY